MIGTQSRRSPEIINFQFTEQQARLLDSGSRQTAAIGGPDVAGAADMSAHHAKALKHSMNTQQRDMLEVFSCGKAAAIEFTAMLTPCFDPVPERLAPIDIINTEPATLYLASRSQILLSLVNYRSFAFDIDNGSMQVRLVGNFKGGGKNLLPDELDHHHVELSSHSGLLLGPHTEPPYNCSINAESGHSPAPSALILTARWNPLQEPTRLIPVRNAVANSTDLRHWRFHRNHSRHAYRSLKRLLSEAKSHDFQLHPGSALLINNSQTLHAREIVKDNRRLLIRLFGYSPDARPLILQQDPLVVRG